MQISDLFYRHDQDESPEGNEAIARVYKDLGWIGSKDRIRSQSQNEELGFEFSISRNIWYSGKYAYSGQDGIETQI